MPDNRRALAQFLADSVLAGCNGSASGPASAGNRLVGRSSIIVDALTLLHYSLVPPFRGDEDVSFRVFVTRFIKNCVKRVKYGKN